MISERAKTGLDQMLIQGLRSSLPGPDDQITELHTLPNLDGIAATRVVMLSVASYRFRLMVLIYFSPDEATRAHFARARRVSPAELGEQAFIDAISECANLCCGTFNRELGRVYPHIGMSTPNIMDRRCAQHLSLMEYGHLQHFVVRLNQRHDFHASLCVCEYEDLDFEVPPSAEPESTGELEFF